MSNAVAYRMRKWYDHWTIFLRLRGSVLPNTLIAVILSTVLCYIYWEFALHKGDTNKGANLMGNPSVYGYFMSTAGVLLAFTTNICYNRFWDSLGVLVSWSQGMAYIGSMILCFESDKKFTQIETHRWQARMIHLLSILHAVCIEQLYCAEGANGASLDILGGLTTSEKQQLELAMDQPSAVCHWLNMEISNRTFQGGFDIPPPIAAQLWNVIGSSMVNYANAVKYAQNRVPLSFQQCLAASDLIMLAFTPLAIASFVPNLALAILLTFICTLIYHSIYLADTSMQQPFGDKSRDLPLIDLHKSFINKILTCLSYEVLLELHELYEEAARVAAIHPNRKVFAALRMGSTVSRAMKAADASRSASDTSGLGTEAPNSDDENAAHGSTRIAIGSPLRKRRERPETTATMTGNTFKELKTLRSQDPENPCETVICVRGQDNEDLPIARELRLPPQGN